MRPDHDPTQHWFSFDRVYEMAFVDFTAARRVAWLFAAMLAIWLAHPAQTLAQPRFDAALTGSANLGPLPRFH